MISIILCICLPCQPLFKNDLLPVFLLLEYANKTLLHEYVTMNNRPFFVITLLSKHYNFTDKTCVLKVTKGFTVMMKSTTKSRAKRRYGLPKHVSQ